MAGHDFMDFDGTRGGSDACTDMDAADNKGLLPCLSEGEFGRSLQEVYGPVCSEVSLADFIVIAGEAVMVKTRKISQVSQPSRPSLDFTTGPHRFKFGRETRIDTCEFAEGLLPNPEDGCDAVKRVFVDNMKLGNSVHKGRELKNSLTAALMGVHTLGRAMRNNSGYEGWWSRAGPQKEFTNDYYISMIVKGWMPEQLSTLPPKNQWRRSDGGSDHREMMLDTDICLAYAEKGSPVKASRDNCCAWLDPPLSNGDGIPDSLNGLDKVPPHCAKGAFGDTGRANCCDGNSGVQDCGSPLRLDGFAADAVRVYAEDESAWLDDFRKAWSIATTNGHNGLKDLDHCVSIQPVHHAHHAGTGKPIHHAHHAGTGKGTGTGKVLEQDEEEDGAAAKDEEDKDKKDEDDNEAATGPVADDGRTREEPSVEKPSTQKDEVPVDFKVLVEDLS